MHEKRFGMWVFILGVLLTYGIEYTVESSFMLPRPAIIIPHNLFLFNIAAAVMICMFTVIGSYAINKWFERHTAWMKKPAQRMAFQGVLTLVYSVLLGIYSVHLSSFFFTEHTLSPGYMQLTLVLSCTISILLSSAYTVFFYFMQWERSWRESEDLKNENLQSQFNALKSQINPHFLFNNLNTLSGLITENPATATDFVQKLANVYRYVLQAMDKRLVDLETELNFLDAYVYLLKMRFQHGLSVTTSVPENVLHYSIAPLTLQILIENAVKHNIISAEHPLSVNITYHKSGYLMIANNIQKKQSREAASTNVGLQNIYRRYRFLEQRQISIEETASEFIVRIPLIGKDAL
ncbi:MAG TPA: histidine kinase [Bacteroidota bacterium]|nr:histidine kinase [Bacteroidota bacterium]